MGVDIRPHSRLIQKPARQKQGVHEIKKDVIKSASHDALPAESLATVQRFVDEPSLRRFEKSLAMRTGLQLRPREREVLRDTLADRMVSLRFLDEDQYYRLLQASNPDAENEWDELVACLTNNESYFFRDKGQMLLLREQILPELIERNQKLSRRPSLRLWSAGCSTGEEAYSLAMLVEELLPRRSDAFGADWEIVIHGTDIDEQALQKARRGVYAPWSLRTMEPGLWERYFHRLGNSWQVKEATRSAVTFARCNLVGDPFPDTAANIRDMDLILCRNVFIYFEHKAVATVLPKFARTLREGGYLMTGHAEIQGQPFEPLRAHMYPQSAVYQRLRSSPTAEVASPVIAQRSAGTLTVAELYSARRVEPVALEPALLAPSPAVRTRSDVAAEAERTALTTTVAESLLVEAEARYDAGDYQSVVALLHSSPRESAASERLLLLLAHAQANLGDYEAATGSCMRLINSYPDTAAPYEMLATIAQEQGRYEEAKTVLKKALYLMPSSPAAYLELAALYEREGDTKRARQMRVTALELLMLLPATAASGIYGRPSPQEWILHLKYLLAEEA